MIALIKNKHMFAVKLRYKQYISFYTFGYVWMVCVLLGFVRIKNCLCVLGLVMCWCACICMSCVLAVHHLWGVDLYLFSFF